MRRSQWNVVLLSVSLLAPGPVARSAAEEQSPPPLLGPCSREQLEREPYSEWYESGRAAYAPEANVLERIRQVGLDGVEIAIYFGTWCGDSRREVPRMIKLLEELDFPSTRLRLIAVDREPGALKRSPGGEERGLEIYRVPTLVVRRAGREISRIVEFPALSLERDLLAILSGEDYRPSYASYPTIRRWLGEGLLADPNVSARGLASALLGSVVSEGELRAAAAVMLDRGQVAEAVKLHETNCELYPESARCPAALAEARLRACDREGAREAAERALRLETDRERTAELVELLGRALQTTGER